MSKLFLSLSESVNDVGTTNGKLRSKGEEDFKNLHKKKDTEYPAKDTDDVLNARSTNKTTHTPQPNNGDRTPVQQGSSRVDSFFKWNNSQTPPNRGDNRQGDKEIVRTSPSSVKGISEEESLTEKYKDRLFNKFKAYISNKHKEDDD